MQFDIQSLSFRAYEGFGNGIFRVIFQDSKRCTRMSARQGAYMIPTEVCRSWGGSLFASEYHKNFRVLGYAWGPVCMKTLLCHVGAFDNSGSKPMESIDSSSGFKHRLRSDSIHLNFQGQLSGC